MTFNDSNNFFAAQNSAKMQTDVDSELKDLWKVSNFIKTNVQSNSKIVLDKNLAHLQEGLSSSFGSDRVVVDRRQGSRRGNADRRATFDSRNETSFFDKRAQDDRRQNERRSNGCYFLSESIFSLLDKETY